MIVETGRAGRIAYTHVRPNEDLVQAVQKVALMHGFRTAFVRGTLGSLTDACLAGQDGTLRELTGPAIEVLSVVGEVRSDREGAPEARLSGVVADTEGRVFGGRFVSGRNPVCMTFELVLEEWIADGEGDPVA
jgi:predicted DNA-binding protein with PD1-like motif